MAGAGFSLGPEESLLFLSLLLPYCLVTAPARFGFGGASKSSECTPSSSCVVSASLFRQDNVAVRIFLVAVLRRGLPTAVVSCRVESLEVTTDA